MLSTNLKLASGLHEARIANINRNIAAKGCFARVVDRSKRVR